MIRHLGGLALVAITLFAAGCGNSEQNDYVDQINELQAELVSDVNEATTTKPPATAADAAAIAGDLEQAFSDGADGLDAVEPPEEVADLHARLVAEIRAISTQIGEAENTLENGTPEEASQAALELQGATGAAQTELETVINRINSTLGE